MFRFWFCCAKFSVVYSSGIEFVGVESLDSYCPWKSSMLGTQRTCQPSSELDKAKITYEDEDFLERNLNQTTCMII